MHRSVSVACVQHAMSWDIEGNLLKAEELVRSAAADGAHIILLSEFFYMPYFCQEQKEEHFRLASPVEGNLLIQRFSVLAKDLKVVLPVSFFEKASNSYFNSIAIIDADGSTLGVYRKSHIPDGPGYQEKFYFNPGDTGFMVFDTMYARIGVAICWDQWFPEAARAMVLQGAEILFYPTAIGSEPQDPSLQSYPHWARTMTGHSAANLVPVVASNRIGTETFEHSKITFYGGSFITDNKGAVVRQLGAFYPEVNPDPASVEGFVSAKFDLDGMQLQRASWGLFRDRRPDLYGPLLTLDGKTPAAK